MLPRVVWGNGCDDHPFFSDVDPFAQSLAQSQFKADTIPWAEGIPIFFFLFFFLDTRKNICIEKIKRKQPSGKTNLGEEIKNFRD